MLEGIKNFAESYRPMADNIVNNTVSYGTKAASYVSNNVTLPQVASIATGIFGAAVASKGIYNLINGIRLQEREQIKKGAIELAAGAVLGVVSAASTILLNSPVKQPECPLNGYNFCYLEDAPVTFNRTV